MSEPLRSALLPPNQTTLESTLAKLAAMGHTPEILQRLWDAERCPAELLPWLAWALSVDEWDEAWTESQQRAQILGSIAMHRKKGTPWAVKQALTRSGVEMARLIEHIDGAHWAEFDVDITVIDRPLTEQTINRAVALIEAYKSARSHLRRLVISLASKGTVYLGAFTMAGDIVTVRPLQVTEINALPLSPRYAIGVHDWGTTTVYPR